MSKPKWQVFFPSSSKPVVPTKLPADIYFVRVPIINNLILIEKDANFISKLVSLGYAAYLEYNYNACYKDDALLIVLLNHSLKCNPSSIKDIYDHYKFFTNDEATINELSQSLDLTNVETQVKVLKVMNVTMQKMGIKNFLEYVTNVMKLKIFTPATIKNTPCDVLYEQVGNTIKVYLLKIKMTEQMKYFVFGQVELEVFEKKILPELQIDFLIEPNFTFDQMKQAEKQPTNIESIFIS